jgi:hypothetical protein
MVEKEDGSGQAVCVAPWWATAQPLVNGTHNGCGNSGRAGVASRGEAPRAGEGQGGQVSCLWRGAPAL